MKIKLFCLILFLFIFTLTGCTKDNIQVENNLIEQQTEDNNQQVEIDENNKMNVTNEIIEIIMRTFDNGEYNVFHIDKDLVYAKNYINIETSILYQSSDWIDFIEVYRFENISGRFYVNPFINTELFFVSGQIEGESGIWYSGDSGATWNKVFDKPIESLAFCNSNNSYYALSIDYHNKSTTLYKSNNQMDWIEKSILKDVALVNHFAVDPYDERQIVLTTRGKGLMYTTDEGITWSYLNEGTEIIDALFTEWNDDFYYTTWSGHIYLKTKAGLTEVKKPDEMSDLRVVLQTLTLRKGTDEIYLMLTSGVEDYLIRIIDGKIDDEFRYYIDKSNTYSIQFNNNDFNELYLLESTGVTKMTLTFDGDAFLNRMQEKFKGLTIEELNLLGDRMRKMVESSIEDKTND